MTEVAATTSSSFALSKGRGKGHRMLAITFGAVTNSYTFDTGLDHIDAIGQMRIEGTDNTHDLTVASVSKGVLTFGVAGGCAAAYVTVIGSVKGYSE